MALLQIQAVSHQFMGTGKHLVPALENVSLELPQGTFTCLVGPSGCGKSTLLRIAAGLIRPSAGKVLFHHKPLLHPQRQISLVFQRDNLMPWRTVYQNIVLPLQLAGISGEEQRQRANHWLEITGLMGFEEAYPAELSGGMAQRVALARGLITQPDLLLLDEPFGALDALTRETMWEELLRVWTTTSATVLMVTHSIREAILLADNVLVMSPRPGKMMKSFPIPFPRPRAMNLLTAHDFAVIESQIRTEIRTDAPHTPAN